MLFWNGLIGGSLIILTIYYSIAFQYLYYTWNDYLFDVMGAILVAYTVFFTYSQIRGKNSKFSNPLRIGLNLLSLFVIIEMFCMGIFPIAVLLMLFVLMLNILISKPWGMVIMYALSIIINIFLIYAVLSNCK
jgi:hypothetical protein